ncbi:hypothetical protein FHS27_006597 [Rhodopirellula rubra]|uniref:Uncharacterized protein n=1 Tax=Aporhodopirellula rubra TaxID=980271 RepID=A0A7W5E5S4_9BACT|nr:hypothetical protein [Aporhodopirellula rubra]MBB3210749.1 hypothetical protein [Aporhodopirellula rubra]
MSDVTRLKNLTLDVDRNALNAAIELLADASLVDDELEKRAASLHEDALTVRRLIDWPPEAFGLVLIGHKWSLTLPQTFFANDERGRRREFPFIAEPLFAACAEIATQMIHNENDRDRFTAIASRGAMLDTIHNAVESGSRIDGCVLFGPMLLGIPAEIYRSKPPSAFGWLRALFRGRVSNNDVHRRPGGSVK